MKPIEYFLDFNQGKEEFVQAAQGEDLLPKIEAVKKMTFSAHIITEKYYSLALHQFFLKEAKENQLPEARKIFTELEPIVHVFKDGLKLAASFYSNLSRKFSSSIKTLTNFKGHISCDNSEEEKCFNIMVSDRIKDMERFYKMVFIAITLNIRGTNVPLMDIISLVKTFAPDSVLMREEDVRIELN